VLLAAVTIGAPAAGAAVPCGPARAHTLAGDRTARVYASGQSVFGCAKGGGRSYHLGSSSRTIDQPHVGPVAVAGDLAAYGATQSGVDTVSASVVVRRLTDGVQLRDEPATTKPVGAEFFESVGSVVVRADGAVAWISAAGSVISGQAKEVEVNRTDRGGRTLLDSGPSIKPQSLRRHGAHITWRDGDRSRFAELR
jgi:hypothetical protein